MELRVKALESMAVSTKSDPAPGELLAQGQELVLMLCRASRQEAVIADEEIEPDLAAAYRARSERLHWLAQQIADDYFALVQARDSARVAARRVSRAAALILEVVRGEFPRAAPGPLSRSSTATGSAAADR